MKTIVKRFASGVQKYGPLFKRYDSHKEQEPPEPSPKLIQQSESNLEDWLDFMDKKGGDSEKAPVDLGPHAPGIASSRAKAVLLSLGDLSLYRCSWCGNPSAILKKCTFSLLWKPTRSEIFLRR